MLVHFEIFIEGFLCCMRTYFNYWITFFKTIQTMQLIILITFIYAVCCEDLQLQFFLVFV